MQTRLRYRRARFTEMTMHPESETAKYPKWLKRKSELLEEIDQHEHQLATLKAKLKQSPKHITWRELEDKDKFNRLIPGRKRLMDAVRMIAYRAETAMAAMLLGPTVDMPDARQLLQGLFVTDADLLPDRENNRLCVRIHNARRRRTIDRSPRF